MLMICFSLFSAKSNATKKLKFATAEVTLKMCRLICTFNMVSQGRKQSPPFLFFPSFFLPTHIFLLPFLQSRSRNPTSMMSTCTATEKGKKNAGQGQCYPLSPSFFSPSLFLSLPLSLLFLSLLSLSVSCNRLARSRNPTSIMHTLQSPGSDLRK